MRIALLTTLTMIAFAMNSVLNRAAIDGEYADAASFALVRVLAGAVVLAMVLTVRGTGFEILNKRRWMGALSLAVYLIGFSLAYLTLDAGLGALILFGTVQIALFAYATLWEVIPTRNQVIGAGIAFAGLCLALWPGAQTGSLMGAIFMVAAGLGWAAYTLIGRGAADPIAATATQFLICLPFMAVLLIAPELYMTPMGMLLAIVSGGLTSGLGYALWYAVLPHLAGARAAIVQLSVPVIAMVLGALFLAEPIGLRVLIAAVLVIGGIAVAITAKSAPAGRT